MARNRAGQYAPYTGVPGGSPLSPLDSAPGGSRRRAPALVSLRLQRQEDQHGKVAGHVRLLWGVPTQSAGWGTRQVATRQRSSTVWWPPARCWASIPIEYFKDVATRLVEDPDTPPATLTPWAWQEERAQRIVAEAAQEVQAAEAEALPQPDHLRPGAASRRRGCLARAPTPASRLPACQRGARALAGRLPLGSTPPGPASRASEAHVAPEPAICALSQDR